MAEHLHDGHRVRVKQKYIDCGLSPFATHELVEMLLFFGIPQRDTNPVAHRLLAAFGSVSEILKADRKALLQVEGVSENAATLLTLVGDVQRYCAVEKRPRGMALRDTAGCVSFLSPQFDGQANEVVWMVSLDNIGRVIASHEVSRGTPNMSEIGVRKVLQYALNDNAVNILLAHNHPAGIALPSRDDLQTTVMLARALQAAGMRLLDHLIFARDGDCTSMKDTASLQRYLVGQTDE